MNAAELAKYVDHTVLKPDAPASAFEAVADEAIKHGFIAVCVPGCRIEMVRDRLGDSGVLLATVVGFPHGNTLTSAKALETREAVAAGAVEIDMVINVGALKDGDDAFVRDDIRAVVEAAGDAHTKVIIETALLTEDEKRRACALSEEAGAHFVKTSTGFAGGGATVEDVRLMREMVGDRLGVKASGGIKTSTDALRMIEAGASRLGCSASVAIVEGV